MAEQLCRQQASAWQVPAVCLRLFNVYGPGQHPSFLVPYVISCLVHQQPLVLRMPEALRDFIYVADVVTALEQAAQLTVPGFHIFNIGSGQAVQVMELVQLAESVFGAAVEWEIASAESGELTTMIADIRQAQQVLNWTPQVSLREGLLQIHAQWALAQDPA
ncbi:NAD-dependent epimerase/dehydratase family protein [Neosynechococcus sphagnicola]|uniref:NAD-dependent epimerase/dehydratase family protein n=1 Tax=Neosynechococcus sphagnicola TaxID=1501145 RepID=UPI003B834C4A